MPNTKISALTSATTPLAGTETLPVVQSSTTKQVSVANLTAGRAVSAASYTPTGTSIPTNGIYSPAANQVAIANNGVQTALFNDANNVQIGSSSGSTARVFVYANNSAGDAAGNAGVYVRQDGTNHIQAWAGSGGNIRAYIASDGKFTLDDDNLIFGTAAKGVNFTANTPAAGMTSQLLNWYEEGTWTPTSYDITYATATGTYTRVGREVFVHFTITLPTTSDANNITINGFPFTVSNTNDMRSGCIGYTNYGTACMPTAVINATRGNILKFDGTAVTNVSASGKTFSGVFIYNV
jgi:hypothetical protein